MASRRAKFVSGLPPPWLAATMIARPYFVKIAARLASLTPLWCLIPAQCECPDIVKRNNEYSIRNQEKIRRKERKCAGFFREVPDIRGPLFRHARHRPSCADHRLWRLEKISLSHP